MDENELIKLVYPNIENNGLDNEFMCNRAILAAKNVDVDNINELASNYFPGENIFIGRFSYLHKTIFYLSDRIS